MNIRLKPVIICGTSCTGKSTVADLVAKHLNLSDAGRPSAGNLFRRLAKEFNKSLAEMRAAAREDSSIDLAIDEHLLGHIRRREAVVLDSRVLGWLSKKEGLDAFKVLMTVSPLVAAMRFAKRENCHIKDAVDHIFTRDNEDAQRLSPLYRWDPLDTSYYDLVLDTELHAPSVLAAIIVSAASK
jgi:cytidylate kinase